MPLKNRFLKVLFTGFLFVSVVWGQTQQVRPLPPIQEVESSLESSDQAIEKLIVTTEAVEIPQNLRRRFEFQQDFVAIEVNAILDAIKDQSVPNSEKEIILVRYTMGDSRVDEALIAARNAGIKTTLVADFNPVVKVDFQEGEKYTADPTRFKIPQGGDSHSSWLGNLMKAGFKIGENIFSQPVYNSPNEDDRTPIMHEKSLLVKVGKKTTLYKGTGNLAPNPRYNRIYKITDPLIFQEYYEHVQELVAVYKEGKPTSEIPLRARRRIVYKDGTYFELAYTNGKLNPNNRIVDALTQYKLVDGTLSHFVITHRGFLEALEKAMEQNKQAKLFVVADDRFAELKGWGLAPVFEGIRTVTQFGRGVEGFSRDLYQRITTFIYQREALDPVTGEVRPEYTQDGPPTARHVWHDKTSFFKFLDKQNRKIQLLFSGSFNLSNNAANAESQFEMSLREGSWLAEATELSVRKVAQSQPKWAVRALPASIRNALGSVFGLTDLEVPLDVALKLEKAATERRFEEVRDILFEVSKIETKQSRKIPPDIKQARLEQFLKFFAWYETKAVRAYAPDIKLRHFLSIAQILGIPHARHYEKAMFIDKLLWRPGISKAEMNQLIIDGVAILAEGAQYFNDGTPPPRPPLDKVYSFDFDDTIMRLSTKIILFSKSKPGQTKEISSTEFAEVRSKLGVSGEWADFEVRTNPNSFEYFRTTPEKHFVKDVIKALESGDESTWKTKQTDLFMEILESKESADLLTIITARGHDRSEILEGLTKLVEYYTKKTGKKYYLPKEMNIYAVGKAANPSAEKAVVMTRILDFLLKIGVKKWIFLDDDKGNIDKMTEVYEKEKARWPTMEIEIKYVPYHETKPASPVRSIQPTNKQIRGVLAPGSCRAALRMQAS